MGNFSGQPKVQNQSMKWFYFLQLHQIEKKVNAHGIETISKKHLLVNIDIDKPRIYIGPSRFMVYVNLAHDSKADVFGEGYISDILFQYF